ncbi:GNAT family N-acetyltransferase [Microlunatus parietis]|uniref:Ribosomal protein S18 acetylase RimI-like enzyme n=2 Tax=Microlunatus parietis TaxID=682979 RepID=A0A7Y9IDH9_9ACTN|nr:ribosomal protein S18 acetylase RimI-like enzyme [Microlunatus parietis]
MPIFRVRDYASSDRDSWLRCRLLGFFETDYYDDVWTERPDYERPAIRLVAVDGATVIGILDLVVDGELATIETVVVHPDARGQGIASALLGQALQRLPIQAGRVDAWTREDRAANAWYRRAGFREDHRYLHVYLGPGESRAGFSTPDELDGPMHAFLHARIEDEDRLRARFRRVYVCRRYVLDTDQGRTRTRG